MKTKKIPARFVAGEIVKVYHRRYVRLSRGPGRPARYTYHYAGLGVLMDLRDPAAWEGTHMAGKTAEEIAAFMGAHLGLANATGGLEGDGLTDGNNVVRMADGQMLWLYREQVRKVK